MARPPKEGKCEFPTIEFYRSVHEIPHFNGLIIYCLQFGARRCGGGLIRKQGEGGTGIHQKIFVGLLVSYKTKLCMARKGMNYRALWQN
jgi:hypothetical protein